MQKALRYVEPFWRYHECERGYVFTYVAVILRAQWTEPYQIWGDQRTITEALYFRYLICCFVWKLERLDAKFYIFDTLVKIGDGCAKFRASI